MCIVHTVKKVNAIPVPSSDVTYQTIPAGDGKIANLFYSVDFKKAVNGLRVSGLKLP